MESAYYMEMGRVAESQCAVVVGMAVERGLMAEGDTEPAAVVARDHYFASGPGSTHLHLEAGSHLVAADLVGKVFAPLLTKSEKP